MPYPQMDKLEGVLLIVPNTQFLKVYNYTTGGRWDNLAGALLEYDGIIESCSLLIIFLFEYGGRVLVQ